VLMLLIKRVLGGGVYNIMMGCAIKSCFMISGLLSYVCERYSKLNWAN
jgi:hypothetical protein